MPGLAAVPNNALPLSSEGVLVVGAGGAANRMKAAKLTVSAMAPPPVGLIFVESSGVGLNTQPATADRSFGNPSLETQKWRRNESRY